MNNFLNVTDIIAQDTQFDAVSQAFVNAGNYMVYGISGTQKAFVTALSVCRENRPLLIVTHDREHKEQWERDLQFFCPEMQTLALPVMDRIRFVATAKGLEIQAKVMLALSRLATGRPVAVVATIEEATQYLPAPDRVRKSMVTITKGDILNRDDLLETLVAMGYERTEQVEQRGHFAVRGDILDIFTVNRENPIRIEFFGDEIDTIRTFSIETQRSVDFLTNCLVLPVRLEDAEEMASFLSYGEKGTVILDEPSRLQEQLKAFLHENKEHEENHFDWRSWLQTMNCQTCTALSFLQQKITYLTIKESIGMTAKSMTSFERQIPLLTDEIRHWLTRKNTVALVIHNQQRREGLEQALQRDNIPYVVGKAFDIQDTPQMGKAGVVTILPGLVTEGFELPNSRFILVSEANIYGRQKRKLRRRAEKGREITYFTDLTPGDYVVHSVHGIGKYVGLKNIETEGIHRDYLEIDYAGTDRLFLPAENVDQLQKYIGNEGVTPRLHKMGGAEWRKVTTKAKKSIDDLAEKLVALYAQREIVEGYAFLPDQPWQQEFEDAFPYEETPDQLQATEEIKYSMEQPHPMDRLLCGDVGFGKTEVAMRAIFKAVMSGKQVAVLVPTTILAQQHYQTFLQRFSPFGVKVSVLNRFRSAAEKKAIVKDVASGKVDVLIGTHALLNKKVGFKALGLLVVDEEQRFGVAQKETWKSWANAIDVLTLSATPIPRTLHMSLVGVREMSVINTPPEERLPVQTYVAEYDMNLIVEAIRREISRGGQVYFVYNRVQSIAHMGELLEAAMPNLRYSIAHGQMTGAQMEAIMVDFYEGRYDVLLCTSIVENGIDVPNANTIIVYDADRLGLSQLYQMRGRVGRSARRAYAYFLYRKDKVLSETAEKRLRAVKEFTELGSGFKLAMRDLEIRGAGSLLGSKQHGNIASVGFATYSAMLAEAIGKAQHKDVPEKPPVDPAIDLKIDAFIDDAYIRDSGRKISLYQRLLRIKDKAELDDFAQEVIDRFGSMTKPVDNLLRLAYIKEEARLLGIRNIQLKPDWLEIVWDNDAPMADWDMGQVSQPMWKRMHFLKGKPSILRVDIDDSGENILSFTEKIMKELAKKYQNEL